jgi:hypothetical protein
VRDLMPRRRVLIASAAGLPLLFATASCSSADFFTGPDPLDGPPPLGHGTVMLGEAIAAENQLIMLYKSAIPAYEREPTARASVSILLNGMLAQHGAHLSQLRALLVVPPGASASAVAQPSASPAAGGALAHPVSSLRAAERQSASSLLLRLSNVEPALAQLFASIAASDATHVTALTALGGGGS